MPDPEDLSILSKWLEQRLKEYFIKKSRGRKRISGNEDDHAWLLSLSANQDNVTPIETAMFDFRILDLKLESEESELLSLGHKPFDQEAPTNDQDREGLLDEVRDELLDLAVGRDNEPYQQRNSYVYLVYQVYCQNMKNATSKMKYFQNQKANPFHFFKSLPNRFPIHPICPHLKHSLYRTRVASKEGSQSVGKELQLHMCASKFELTKPNPQSEGKSSRRNYILSMDEHEIDVYTKVIPVLKEWSAAKNVAAFPFPIPECYYGSYETEESAVEPPSAKKERDNQNEILLVEDDIMSKVAAGMEILEREKKKQAYLTDSNAPVKQSGSRLLILEDIYSDGYKLRNVTDSTFLSLMNVEHGLKSLAAIHSISWAFSKATGKSLVKIWPFLNNQSYLSYVSDRVMCGYPVMVGLVREYLTRESGQEDEGKEDQVTRVLESLMKLRTRILEIVEGAHNPSPIQCLIHQDARFSSFLFRYSVVPASNKQAGCNNNKGNKQEEDNKNVKGSAGSLSNDVTKARRDPLPDKGLRREVMIINWRTASFGSPMIDVAFLLMTALPPMTRRAETAALLRIYWNTFQMHARKFGLRFAFSEKDMFQEYLAALLYTCVLITGNIEVGSKLSDDEIEVFVEVVNDLIEEGLM